MAFVVAPVVVHFDEQLQENLFAEELLHVLARGLPDPFALILCVVATFIGARVSAVFANRAEPAALNRITGIVLAVLGLAMIAVRRFS